ncbi:zinc finger protein 43-like isoform X2 [Aphidius gifuensis]|nr:zinc finger protein 43-like isoform X2 [Aphidius gifuensis]XP_044001161.1 zinc finger protein 43-like isoform X2 [Aphidius gifuensis]XP_044001162.1 zinc finger protein 43-like isoform X2 [Aphidius gifuensis]
MAHKAQEKLKNKFYEISGNNDKLDDNEFDDNNENNKNDIIKSNFTDKKIEEINSGYDCSIRSIDQDENQHTTEEMEVKVDPMIFLQCDLENSLSSELSDDNSDYEDKSNHINDYFERKEIKKNCKSPTMLINNENNGKSSLYDCSICSRTFITQISLQNHLWSHLPRSDNQYDDDDEDDDDDNNKTVHQSIQNSSLNNDNNSSSGYDNSGTNFVCPICHKRISTKGNLKVHLETHRPKGKYGCDICGRIFKTQSNLFRHKEYHGGVQFPCSVCGRVYPTNSTLRAHSITHSDLRPHACPLCDKTFKRNQDLKFHINQHTGQRPYQCPYCPKAFASSGNCFSHRKRMHPREVNRDRQRAADLMR